MSRHDNSEQRRGSDEKEVTCVDSAVRDAGDGHPGTGSGGRRRVGSGGFVGIGDGG